MEIRNANPLPCASKSLVTQYGEKVGDYFFAPLRKYTFTEQGIKRWYAWPLAARPNEGTGFAATNFGHVTTTYEHVPIPANRVVLVSHAFETMAIRVHIPSPGTYFITASFIPAVFEGEYAVAVCANGKRLWDGRISNAEESSQYSVFLRFTSSGFVDFSINTEKSKQTVPCRAFLKYAVVQCDEVTGQPQLRCDDRASGLDEAQIIQLHSETPFQSIEFHDPEIDFEERVALLEKEWTLSIEYIKSQYQRSPRELVEVMLENKQEASLKYCIFMVPRSGSTLLTELLARTRKLGFPGESFVPDVIRTFSLAFSDMFSSYEEFLLSKHRSENGVYGIEIESERFLQESEFFSDVKNWRHVYIWREDVLAQAISYQISIDTGIWHNFSGSPQDEKFHYISRNTILEKINFLLGVERFFLNFFRDQGLTPYKLSYEDLIADPIGHTRRIAEHIGVDTSDLDIVNEGKVVLQPTAKARNAYYRTLAIGGGGDFWGYDIREADGQFMAVLHGVDLSLLDTAVPRPPLLFLSNDRQELCDTVQDYVMTRMSSLPSLADKG